MDKDKLKEILAKHQKWLDGKNSGEQADLRGANLQRADLRWANLHNADLRGADLRWADLRWANLQRANLQRANLQRADLRWANLRGADLRWANLHNADLQMANLRGADLDFSCWPLWCGSKNVKVDNRIVYQLAAHLCVLDCDTPEYKQIKDFLLPFAKQSHRASDLGLFELSSELDFEAREGK